MEYWLDGIKEVSDPNISFGDVSDIQIYRAGVGISKTSDSDWYQEDWSAIAFDDVVLSTEYVGPESLDLTSPGIPTGLSVL